jgi:hypothetical protein
MGKKKFDARPVMAPTMNPILHPNTRPTARIITVQGCTLGITTKGMRDAALKLPITPTRANSQELILRFSNWSVMENRKSTMNPMRVNPSFSTRPFLIHEGVPGKNEKKR